MSGGRKSKSPRKSARYFEIDEISTDDFNKKQHFLIVANGVDQETIESIVYWKNNGLNIDAIIYWVFEIGEDYYIEFNMYSQVEDFLEYESNHYLLNTNKKSNAKYTQEMLDEHKAAAYSPGWRDKIQKFQKGDTVFLYESGAGIRAYGYASGNLKKKDCDGHKDYEYYMDLDGFRPLKEAITAQKMKEITGHGFNFRKTLSAISEDSSKKIIEYIEENGLSNS